MYKAIIIDDDEVSVNLLQFELQQYKDVRIEGVAKNGIAGIRLIDRVRPDILFLDVELPDMLGIELLNKLKLLQRVGMRVVFYTAFHKYLIDALRNYVFDFLMKPINPEELKLIMHRLKLNFDYREELRCAHAIENKSSDKKFMIVTPTGDMCFLRAAEIGYFRYLSERKIWEAALTNGKFLPLKRSLTGENICCFDSNFIQVHQSFIINQNYLVMVQDNYCVLYPPFDKEVDIQVSKKYRKELMDHFFAL